MRRTIVPLLLPTSLLLILAFAVCSMAGLAAQPPNSPYSAWQHTGSIFLFTTKEGANLPPGTRLTDFPVLVRLDKDFFDFKQARPHGEDIRFATVDGKPLAYEIEEWNGAEGTASLWVRVPIIVGDARQELRIYWGKSDASGASDGMAVFNRDNGFASVFHMNETLQDEVGTLHLVQEGAERVPSLIDGIIGKARHFAGGQGIFGGDKLTDYPSGGEPHTTEAWVRPVRSNTTLIGWGNEGGGRGSKVRMQLRSPAHLHIDSDFSDVNGNIRLALGAWLHIVHTYDKNQNDKNQNDKNQNDKNQKSQKDERGEGKIYINGRLDNSANPTLNIRRPSRFWIGGWYGNYDFVGDMDEVRISRVARSADWVRMEYENQRPLQQVVGMVVTPSTPVGEMSVTPSAPIVLEEGKKLTLTVDAPGALKLAWYAERGGEVAPLAVNRHRFVLDAGRVGADTHVTLRVEAVYPDGVRSKSIPITIRKTLPDPQVALSVPALWNGRTPLNLTAKITNIAALQSSGVGNLHYEWKLSGIATVYETKQGELHLLRSQNSGRLAVELMVDNGGQPRKHTVTLQVREPARDVWLNRSPTPDEKPETGQFYARNDQNIGTLHYNGDLDREKYPELEQAGLSNRIDGVFLKLYADEKLAQTVRQKFATKSGGSHRYTLSARLKPGLIHYRVEFGVSDGTHETTLRTVDNLVCGDAYLIDGQSNAEATAWGNTPYTFTNEWIRTFGSPEGSPNGAHLHLWGSAVGRAPGGRLQIGYWGMELAKNLVEETKIPVCILNGAVGGTRIDQHQRNPDNPEDLGTIYGRLLSRVRQARLTDGIRGIFWHQGENDQGADGPTGGYGWETYRDLFVAMSGGWKRDYPNVQNYYLFQIWPKACAMGIDGSDNRLREVQRRLPALYAHMQIMSTLGVRPAEGCHYPPDGYAQIARLVGPLVMRDNYGKQFTQPVSAPNLLKVSYAKGTKDQKTDELVLEFDQPMAWKPALVNQFYLDGVGGRVVSGAVAGNILRLKLTIPLEVAQITYLDSKAWNQDNILYGQNGIAALTFCEVSVVKP